MDDIYISGNGKKPNRNNQGGVKEGQYQRINPKKIPIDTMNPFILDPYAAQQKRAAPKQRPAQTTRRATDSSQDYQPIHINQRQYASRTTPNRVNPTPKPYHPNPNYGYNSGSGNGSIPPNRGNSTPNNKPPQRTKRGKASKVIISIVLVLVVLFSSAFAMVYNMASKIDYNKEGHTDNIYIDSSELVSDKKVTNILLIGVDGKSSDKSLRSDTMLLVSIDRNNKKLKLTSFLRDTWVLIPSSKKHAKLNASYAYGGPQLVMDTIEYNYNVEIDHYMLVGFDMFKTIIDSFGGIDVEVTKKEADFMRRTAKPTRHIQSGPNVHMNGSQALVYCRIRKLDSDFMRTFRQRKVIAAIIDKAKSSKLGDLKTVADNVLSMVQTDISPFELTKLAFGLSKYITYDIESQRIPAEGTFSYKTINGQSVIATDINQNRQFLHNFIYAQEAADNSSAAE